MTRRFLRYLLTGGGATLVDIGIFTLLHEVLGLWQLLAFAGGVSAGLVTNFLLSRRFVFGVQWQSTFKQFAVFSAVALNGILLNLGAMQFLIYILGWAALLARIFSAALVVGISFLGHSLFSFRKDEAAP
ncbi:GtrA family protein [Anthocerotibacter panamensis]|uniref:GtrA family protein n=1 Tax=Anthocerotibacter panamensis TaxID=2857077 RepID=UPI001C40351B|nr:GtrA family protein [Anthocerotibacter panamensis]